jgi:hypothetical protein
MSNINTTTVKVSTKKELSIQYGITIKTFNKIIQPFEDIIGVKNGRYYTPLQVSKIYECLGLPSTIITD